MSKTILFTRPWNDDGTVYLHDWTEELINKAEKLGHVVIDLAEKRANKKEFTSHLKKSNPSLVHLNGHGSNDVVTGDEQKPILDMRNSNITKGKIVYARACSSAHTLGEKCVENGAKAYIGYSQKFSIRIDLTKTHKPVEDDIAQFTLKPSNKVPMSLIKGHTAKKAIENSQKESRKSMLKLLSSDAPEGASEILKSVYLNMKHQKLIGDPQATIDS